jgi:HNH endonuclease
MKAVVCLVCLNAIVQRDNESPRDYKNRKYCSRSCRNKQINKGVVRSPTKGIKTCAECCQSFQLRKSSNGSYIPRKFCNDCLRLAQAKNIKAIVAQRAINSKELMSAMKKESLFKDRKNWQSARSAIRRYAANIYADSNRPMKCFECGYSSHVEICHVKSVSSFPGNALISEINDLDNLIALCPNHHWEFDNGLLKICRGLESNQLSGAYETSMVFRSTSSA